MTTASGGRPPPVSIDDLAEPRFPPGTEEIRAGTAAMADACPLEPEALCSAAVAATGLDDFGDAGFYERLDLLCHCFRTEAGLSPQGVTSAHLQLRQLLQNRLLIEHTVRGHPEILEQPLDRPIVVCGLPRTGTTHLHNMLAADPRLRALPYWESLEPVLGGTEQPAPGEPDPRLARTAAALDVLDALLPHFRRMHEMTVDHAHEEIQLLAIDFSGMYFETMALMPTWRDAYRERDQTSSYLYLRKVLQVLQWLRPEGERWVLKSPQHLEQFGPLRRAFPDATAAVTHRDPVSVTASLLTMLAYSARLSIARVDPRAIGEYWAPRVEDLLRACCEQRELLPAEHSLDVRFDEFMADELGTVRTVYRVADQPLDPPSLGCIEAFLAQHPRGRHGAVRYELAPFGLDAEERRRALSFYVERFGVAEDWSG